MNRTVFDMNVSRSEYSILFQVLTVPQNFGSIYLGETFSSFVNVQNESQQTVRDVVLKVS